MHGDRHELPLPISSSTSVVVLLHVRGHGITSLFIGRRDSEASYSRGETVITTLCQTCQGDERIMQANGDDEHPLQSVRCPNCTHTFHGLLMSADKFAQCLAKVNRGICPFCEQTGLTNNYGNRRKHIKACIKKQLSGVKR